MTNILITGCSSGIGLATALSLAKAGHRVYATMRNPEKSAELAIRAASDGLQLTVHKLDVNSCQSVEQCFESISQQGAQIDVLINNAGIERHGSTEELCLDDFRSIMETNYFGAIRCIQKVLPAMRQRRNGCIINVTSVAGKIAASPLGAYAASKHALEALSETLAQEMQPFGVRVHIVQPGIIDTPLAHALKQPPPTKYRHIAHLASLFRASLQHPTPPAVVAEVIKEVFESGTWKLRHTAGPDAAPFLAWRASMSDEEWTGFNTLDTASFRDRVRQDFGLELDLGAVDAEPRTTIAAD
ncbi:MAG: oxidoreductase [Candidatus Solibacter sp.]|nr:oxidoreductase [Candidatus Solibacter sp.]